MCNHRRAVAHNVVCVQINGSLARRSIQELLKAGTIKLVDKVPYPPCWSLSHLLVSMWCRTLPC